MSFELRALPIDQLKLAAYNPRKALRPGSPAYKKLKASVAEFGLVEPLVWNELTGHVVGGHARLAVLKELGFKEVPVSIVRLDDKREKALNIVLNNQEAQGRYDPTKLAALLEELEDLPELELTGFDAGTLHTLKMEPVEDRESEAEAGRVEITIVTDEAAFGAFRERLDDLVTEFDLVTHIRRT